MHLHLQVQSGPDFFAPDLKTYPILFRDVTCMRSKRPRADAPFFVPGSSVVRFVLTTRRATRSRRASRSSVLACDFPAVARM